MSTHNQIDLVEFPASSSEQVKAMADFFKAAFGWNFKVWDITYNDTHDSGVTAGINGGVAKEETMPLTVIYSNTLEDSKDKVMRAGGVITHEITSFPGGRRFAFTDPAGNQLAVWSDK